MFFKFGRLTYDTSPEMGEEEKEKEKRKMKNEKYITRLQRICMRNIKKLITYAYVKFCNIIYAFKVFCKMKILRVTIEKENPIISG